MIPLRKYFFTATVLVALFSAAVGLATGVWMLLSDVPGFGGEEANVVYTVQQLVAGDPIYTDPSKPPFTITQYAPLYYVVAAGLARCLGVAAADASTVTLVCRLVSLTSALAVALVTFALVRVRLKLPATVGVLVAAFAFVSAVPWHFLARPDALMTFFLVFAVYLVLRVDPARKRPAHLAAAAAVLVSVLAVLTKQNGVQALALVLLYLVLARAWKELLTALLSGAFLAGLLLALAAPLQRWLGPAVKENLIDGVRNGIDLLAALERTFVPFFSQFALLVALTALAAVSFLRAGPDGVVRRFLGLATLLLLGFACATGLKTGSALNYFIDFVVLAAVTSALYCCSPPRPADASFSQVLPPLVLGSLLLFLPFVALAHFQKCCYAKAIPGTLRPNPRHQFSASGNVADFIRRSLEGKQGGYVLTGECFSVGNLLYPFTVVPQPRIAAISHARGLVDYREFRACVARGKVGYLVTRAGTRPSRFLGVAFERYRLVHEADGFAVFQFFPEGHAGALSGR
jgi:hypothetical protein